MIGTHKVNMNIELNMNISDELPWLLTAFITSK